MKAMMESNMRKGLRECWQERFEVRVGEATNMQWHLSRAWVETGLSRLGEEIWAERPVWLDEWGAHGYEDQWKVVRAGWGRGSERKISRNVGNEVRPSDLVTHDENFQGSVSGKWLERPVRQGLTECLSEEVRGSWVRQVSCRQVGYPRKGSASTQSSCREELEARERWKGRWGCRRRKRKTDLETQSKQGPPHAVMY